VHAGARDLHRDAGLDGEIERLLEDVVPSDAVSLLGPSPAETVLSSSDVFVSTSRSEGFPLVTLEAMAAGLPVVATAVGGVPEQIVHLETGILVPPDDPEAIADWLLRLHDEPELRRRLGEAAARRARSEFTLARQAEGLHRAYLAALDLRFGPRSVRRRVRESAVRSRRSARCSWPGTPGRRSRRVRARSAKRQPGPASRCRSWWSTTRPTTGPSTSSRPKTGTVGSETR